MDKFEHALLDLRGSMPSDDLDLSITEIADDHGISAAALRTRAQKAWGDLEA